MNDLKSVPDQIQEDRLYRLLRVIINSVKTKSFFGTHYITKNLTLHREHHGASFLKIDGSLPVKAMFCFLFYFIYLQIHRLIDWLVFNANFSSISAISWRFISIQIRCLHVQLITTYIETCLRDYSRERE
jgi:hypothetical protein